MLSNKWQDDSADEADDGIATRPPNTISGIPQSAELDLTPAQKTETALSLGKRTVVFSPYYDPGTKRVWTDVALWAPFQWEEKPESVRSSPSKERLWQCIRDPSNLFDRLSKRITNGAVENTLTVEEFLREELTEEFDMLMYPTRDKGEWDFRRCDQNLWSEVAKISRVVTTTYGIDTSQTWIGVTLLQPNENGGVKVFSIVPIHRTQSVGSALTSILNTGLVSVPLHLLPPGMTSETVEEGVAEKLQSIITHVVKEGDKQFLKRYPDYLTSYQGTYDAERTAWAEDACRWFLNLSDHLKESVVDVYPDRLPLHSFRAFCSVITPMEISPDHHRHLVTEGTVTEHPFRVSASPPTRRLTPETEHDQLSREWAQRSTRTSPELMNSQRS